MQVYGLAEWQVRATVDTVSASTYAGNLLAENVRETHLRDRTDTLFVLRVRSSRDAGARRTSSGRRTIAATWQAHYDVMLALFDAGASRIRSSMADYRAAPAYSATRSAGYDLGDRGRMLRAGPYPTARDAFLAIAERTYDINAGSIMAPAAFGDL